MPLTTRAMQLPLKAVRSTNLVRRLMLIKLCLLTSRGIFWKERLVWGSIFQATAFRMSSGLLRMRFGEVTLYLPGNTLRVYRKHSLIYITYSVEYLPVEHADLVTVSSYSGTIIQQLRSWLLL